MPRCKQFTPEHITHVNCLARTLQNGHGGQCSTETGEGVSYCKKHRTKEMRPHGDVRGPIPKGKLVAFLRAAIGERDRKLEECEQREKKQVRQFLSRQKRLRDAKHMQRDDFE